MTPELTFGCVPIPLVDMLWPDVEKLLTRSLDTAKGKFDLESVRTSILSGELVLWLVLDGDVPVAAITTRIIVYPRRRALALDWIGGSRMKEWLPMAMETMRAHAKRNDCEHIEGYGRKAWGRWLEKYSWKPEYVAYRMELTDG